MTDAADSPYSSSSSLATPRPSADAADEPSSPAAPIFQTLSEIMYASHGHSLKALAVLSLGLKNNDGSPTFDPSVLPWSAALRPSALKMTAKDLRDEVKRRSEAAGDDALTAPRPKQWTVGKATEWLETNPIVADDEVAFIRHTIQHRINVAELSNCSDVFRRNAPPHGQDQEELLLRHYNCYFYHQHIHENCSS